MTKQINFIAFKIELTESTIQVSVNSKKQQTIQLIPGIKQLSIKY